MASYSFVFRTSMCSTLRAANAFKSVPIRFVYSNKRVARLNSPGTNLNSRRLARRAKHRTCFVKMPPRIAHPRKSAGVPSSLTRCSAAADKIVGNDFEQPFYGWPEGRISGKRFVTIQTSSRKASEHRIRSSVSSSGRVRQKQNPKIKDKNSS